LAHQVRAVVVGGLCADAEAGGNLLRALAPRDHLEDLALAVGEHDAGAGAAGGGLERPGDGWPEVGPAQRYGSQALLEFLEVRRLLDEAHGPRLEHPPDKVGVLI